MGTIITDANAALLKLPMEVPLNLRAPFDVAEVRYGLTEAPVAGASGFVGFQLQGDVVPLSYRYAASLAVSCCTWSVSQWHWDG